MIKLNISFVCKQLVDIEIVTDTVIEIINDITTKIATKKATQLVIETVA